MAKITIIKVTCKKGILVLDFTRFCSECYKVWKNGHLINGIIKSFFIKSIYIYPVSVIKVQIYGRRSIWVSCFGSGSLLRVTEEAFT